MGELWVESLGGGRHRIAVRGHEIVVDQPRDSGGDDVGPTPTELFVASLAGCVAFYAHRGLGPRAEGPRVRCHWEMSETPPWRVRSIAIDVEIPADTTEERVAAVRRAVSHCTVHNSLLDAPDISIAAHRSGEPAATVAA